uniref:MAK10-like protein n=1 Tax=Tanacetum cinerariifolium TaxID=118510 RepID=A0A6L2M2T0_TANCI|nr:MAK10-like protein [Tanacetum cinerariifolium]
MEAHIAPMQPTQVSKITSSYEICSGPHDTQYCMENPKHAFVKYASSRTDEAREFVCTKGDDGDMMFIKIVKKNDDSGMKEPKEDRRRGVEYAMSKILRFYKECLELRPEYVTGMDDEGEVT